MEEVDVAGKNSGGFVLGEQSWFISRHPWIYGFYESIVVVQNVN